jgi:RNA polymerase sigma-70 factor (ECF subfamily)
MAAEMSNRGMTGYEDLIRRFTSLRAGVLGYLRVLVRDPHLAEDLFQETCVVVLRKVEEFDRAGDFGAWVRTIALNLARNALRKQKHLRPMPSPNLLEAIERAHAGESANEAEALASRLEHLGHCLDRVEPRQREMLALRYRGGASLREIAARTGRSEGAVQVALTRIRQFLLRCIEQERRGMSHGLGSA